MKSRENFAMDSPPTTTFTRHRNGIHLSRTTLCIITAIVLCCLCGTAFLIYHFLQCHNQLPSCNLACSHDPLHPHHHHQNNQHGDSGSDPRHGDEEGDEGQKKPEPEVLDLFLPKSVVPLQYDLQFVPFLDEGNFTFNGVAKIRVNVTENCKNITLHARLLKIDRQSLNVWHVREQRAVDVVDQVIVEEKQFYVIHVEEELQKGEIYEVKIKFQGMLNTDLEGFYRSKYEVGNETRWIATTQFQPTDARKAFPCFDEPALKAKFNISIGRPKTMRSISNMPQKKQDKIMPVDGLPDYVWDYYEESVKMSTYLVAFVVCDFEVKYSGNFGTWARPDSIKSAEYALKIGPQVLQFFEGFFKIKFPLPKIDMIAIPDFAAGAMENFGLITYRESAMLYDENISALKNKQRVASVVSHELAHQWFGNLVTPSWWSDLWLNEGFANYVEYLGVNAVEPTWQFLDQFVVIELHNVMELDSLASSHTVSVRVDNPAQINDIFDRISYAKGASIIRMMDHFLSREAFRSGLHNYLDSKKYSDATQDELWHFLTEAGHAANTLPKNVSVKDIMDTWTLQIGFPVLNVNRNYDDGSVELRQEKFNLIPPNNTKTESLWWIPVTFTHGAALQFNDTHPQFWVPKEKSVTFNDIKIPANQWLLMNLQQTGYYRVNYDLRNWRMITGHLMNEKKFKEIAPANRAQLIDDAMSLANAGYLNYGIALNVTRYLKHETDLVPLSAGIKVLDFLDGMLYYTPSYFLFKEYYLKRLMTMYQLMGFDDQPDSDLVKVYTRTDVLRTACYLGFQDCIDRAVVKFHEWQHEANPDVVNKISPNIRRTVYCTAIKYGGALYWEFAWERYKKTNVASEKENLLGSLACTREPWLLIRFMEMALDPESGIRKQDAITVFRAVGSNPIGDLLAFDFVRENWDRIKNYFSVTFGAMNSILRDTTKVTTRAGVDELKRFEKEHGKELGRTIKQAIERAEANVQWLEKNYEPIIEWLKMNQ